MRAKREGDMQRRWLRWGPAALLRRTLAPHSLSPMCDVCDLRNVSCNVLGMQEASIAWEKRQQKMRAKRESDTQKSWLRWGPAATAQAYSGPTSKETRQQSETAAATATAARK